MGSRTRGSRGGIAARDPRNLWVQSESILSISRVVSHLGRAESFYRSALGFRRVSGGPVDPEVLAALDVAERRANEVRMRIGEEEIVLVRNHRPIARLVPEPPAQNALEVLGDLYRTLDDDTADALAEAVNTGRKAKGGKRNEMRNPWAS